jgi:hypothetical protein
VIPITGSATGETGRTEPSGTFVASKTGNEVSSQLLRFGSTQQTTGGGALWVGTGGTFVLSGIASNILSGSHAGAVFGATE